MRFLSFFYQTYAVNWVNSCKDCIKNHQPQGKEFKKCKLQDTLYILSCLLCKTSRRFTSTSLCQTQPKCFLCSHGK
ncbi:unnamed protein product [Musa acuminata subsp. malaccensis]|uniref:(wild Malaysian banana) hypothetical protein n=1 Tax=Musa acuminata subsp. malaccensis TaxID=214687 RepID=A0A804IKZ2_MUSAM|nr:unnamed protein product [Musa acuminata subsp. malaccensis]